MAQYVVKLASDGVILNSEKNAVTKVNVFVQQNSGTLDNPTIAPAPAVLPDLFDIQLFPPNSENNVTVVESKNSDGTYSISFSDPLIPGKTTIMVSIKSPAGSSKLYVDFKSIVNAQGKTTISLPPITSSGDYLFNTDKINGHEFAFEKNQQIALPPAPTVNDSSISAKLVDTTKPYLTAVLWPNTPANVSVELTLNSAPNTPVSGDFEISLCEGAPIIKASPKTN